MNYESYKKHYSKDTRARAEQFISQEDRSAFLDYYKTHLIEDTKEFFNLDIQAIRAVRMLWDIQCMPMRPSTKGTRKKSKYYNNGIVEKMFHIGAQIPEGFIEGRLPFSQEIGLKISKSKRGKSTSATKNKKIYFNGESCIYIGPDEEIPAGYSLGTGRSKKALYHNENTGTRKYFYEYENVPDGWIQGDIGAKDNTNSRKSRLNGIKKHEAENNCTLVSTLKETYKNGWYCSAEFMKTIPITKTKGRCYISNEYIDRISSYNRDDWNSQTLFIRRVEIENDCTLVQTLINKYGQLSILKELPKITAGKFNFISNSYIQEIEKYVLALDAPTSMLEKQVLSFVQDNYSGQIVENSREIIRNPKTGSGLELDIYLPDINVAIEFNGLYFHSDACRAEKEYHAIKSKLCDDLGIRLIHVYEDEWKYNNKKICQLLKAALNEVNGNICFKNYKIKEISNKEAKPFNELFHIHGHSSAQVTYGLFCNEELIQLMSFSKIKQNKDLNADNSWKIVRSYSESGSTALDGASMLFKYFIQEQNPDTVDCYCDFNKFNGKSYESLGMQFSGYMPPEKYWIINNRRYVRAPKNNNVQQKAYRAIWGSGSKKYIWRKDVVSY